MHVYADLSRVVDSGAVKTYYLVGGPGRSVKPVRLRADAPIPAKYLAPGIVCVPHTAVGANSGQPGQNWSPSDPINSVLGALLYEPVRHNARWQILKHLLRQRNVGSGWVSGADLITKYGTEALRRVRELTNDFNWPIDQQRPRVGVGVWDYRVVIDHGYIRQAIAQLP